MVKRRRIIITEVTVMPANNDEGVHITVLEDDARPTPPTVLGYKCEYRSEWVPLTIQLCNDGEVVLIGWSNEVEKRIGLPLRELIDNLTSEYHEMFSKRCDMEAKVKELIEDRERILKMSFWQRLGFLFTGELIC